MEHKICQCGHEHEGRACILCDCAAFVPVKRYRDKKPKVRPWLRRLVKKMDMNQ